MPRRPLSPGEHGEPWTTALSADVHLARVYVRDPQGGRRRVERRGATARDARRAVLTAARAIAAGVTGAEGLDGSTPFRAAADMWLEEQERRVAAPSSLQHYRKRLAVILPIIGDLPLSEVRAHTLKGMFDQLAPTRAVSTLRAYRSVVSGVFRMAMEADAVASNPAAGSLYGYRHRPKVPRALDADERRDLPAALARDEAAPEWLSRLVALMLPTGVRIGEALALRWCDVELDSTPPTITVCGTLVDLPTGTIRREVGKSDAAMRTIPIPARLARQLGEELDVLDDGGPLFPGADGEWMRLGHAHRALRAALDRAGYPWVTSHAFRRTAATILDEQGLTVRAIADMLGHANPALTQNVYFGRRQTQDVTAAALDEAWKDDDV